MGVINSKFNGSLAPYGYRKSEYDKHTLVVDEEAANVVKYIFQMAKEGRGITGICDRLTNENVITPGQYRIASSKNPEVKKIKGKWAASTVNRILHNQVYLGYLKGSDCDFEKAHEPIVEKEIYLEVQERLKNNGRNKTGCNSSYLLEGKVRCKYCGSMLHKSVSRNKTGVNYDYLKCSTKECSLPRVRYDILHSYIEEKILERMNRFTGDQMVNLWFEEKNRELQSLNKQREGIHIKITELKTNFFTLYLDRVKGIVSEEEFIDMKTEIEKQKGSYEKELNKISKMEEEIEKQNMQTKEVHLTRQMLYHFVDYVEVGEKEFIIQWNCNN